MGEEEIERWDGRGSWSVANHHSSSSRSSSSLACLSFEAENKTIMMATNFDFTSWIEVCEFPDIVPKVLAKEGFMSLHSRLHASEEDVTSLSLGRGHVVQLRTCVANLQKEYGGGPLCGAVMTSSDTSGATGLGTLGDLLGRLTLNQTAAAAT